MLSCIDRGDETALYRDESRHSSLESFLRTHGFHRVPVKMFRVRACQIVLLLVWLSEHSKGGATKELPRDFSVAETLVLRICETLLSQSSTDGNITLIFVRIDSSLAGPLDSLRKHPRALVYLSDEPIISRDRDREIVISWERDSTRRRPRRKGLETY